MAPPNHLQVAQAFALWAKELMGDQLTRVILFGSVARGDDSASSDIDLLVEVRGDAVSARRMLGPRIMEIAARDGVFISAFVRPAGEEAASGGTGIYRTVSKEGRVLA